MCKGNMIDFIHLIKYCDLDSTFLGELHKTQSAIGTLEESFVDS